NQYKQECNQYIYAAEFNDTLIGSNVVRKLQATLGLEQDGLFGDSTIKALQKRYGTTVDGIISPISSVVKELQKHLNNNTI
ncbi:MAG: peptidoglycan-binding domain-containing protein, partial [Enterococcus sp.]